MAAKREALHDRVPDAVPSTAAGCISNVTVHSVLCIYCTVREKVIQECINPIAAGDFKWIYAGYWSRSEQ